MEPSVSLSEIKKRLKNYRKMIGFVLMAKPDGSRSWSRRQNSLWFIWTEKVRCFLIYGNTLAPRQLFGTISIHQIMVWLTNVGLKVLGNNEISSINTRKFIKQLILSWLAKLWILLTTYLHLKKVKLGIVIGENIMREAREICGSTLLKMRRGNNTLFQ